MVYRCLTFPGDMFLWVCDLNLVQSGWIVSKRSLFFCCYHIHKKIWRDLGCYGGTSLNLLSKGQPFFGLIQRLVQKLFFCFSVIWSICHPLSQLSSSLCVFVLCFESIIVLFWWRLFVALPESAEREEDFTVLGGTLLIFWHRRTSCMFWLSDDL